MKLFKMKYIFDDVTLLTTVLIDYLKQGVSRDTHAVSMQLDERPIGDEIKSLELSKHPISRQYKSKYKSILFSGRNLIDC